MAKDKSARFRRLVPFFLGGFGIALMIVGIAVNYLQTTQKISGTEKAEPIHESNLRELNPRKISVDIAGAVERPGVYEIPDDSRVKDVLITAGGLSAKANRNYVSKMVNLAQRVSDAMKLYFPFEGEAVALGSGPQNSYQININSATAAQLDDLPGVGPVTAEKIIAARPYQSISELLSKKIVSNSVYQKIKDRLVAP